MSTLSRLLGGAGKSIQRLAEAVGQKREIKSGLFHVFTAINSFLNSKVRDPEESAEAINLYKRLREKIKDKQSSTLSSPFPNVPFKILFKGESHRKELFTQFYNSMFNTARFSSIILENRCSTLIAVINSERPDGQSLPGCSRDQRLSVEQFLAHTKAYGIESRADVFRTLLKVALGTYQADGLKEENDLRARIVESLNVYWPESQSLQEPLAFVFIDDFKFNFLRPKRGTFDSRSLKTDQNLAAVGEDAKASPRLSDRPSMTELSSMPLKNGERIHIIEHIGTDYMMVGTFLLNDHIGTKIDIIEHDNRGQVSGINRQIMRTWLQGAGKRPLTWSTLIDALKHAGLHYLASKVREALE